MVRAPIYDENGVKRGAWSQEEDNMLRDYIQPYGHSNWRELPKFAGISRCGKSCRLRWVNYLQPNLKRGNYTKEEEDTITKLRDHLGNKWSMIAAQLPGRTDNEIKNYWHTHLKSCRRKKNQKKQQSDATSEHIVASIPSNHILESYSYPLSPETSSSTSSNSLHVPEPKRVSEETITSLYTYEQSSGDFWTEPFIPDNLYFPDEYPSPYIDGEHLSPYNVPYNIGDTTDLLYQVMQELPENSAYL